MTVDFRLDGRVALVTGGNGGLGLGIAQGLAAAGASVVVAGRSPEKNERALQVLGEPAIAVQCDVTDPAAVEAAVNAVVEKFGGLDIVVANAGIGVNSLPQEESIDQWQRTLDTNLTSVFTLCKAAYPHLCASNAASIVMITTMVTSMANPTLASYGASKGGLEAMAKSLAVAWSDNGIRVNVIAPGVFWSDLTAPLATDDLAPFREKIVSRVPLDRIADPHEIAGPAVFLASDAASFVTGHTLFVDGGYSVNGGQR